MTARQKRSASASSSADNAYVTTPQDSATTAMRHAIVPLDALTPHPRNYRRHPDAQLSRLESSLARFGQVRSIVVQQGAGGRYLIVAGHGIADAAKRQGLKTLRADVIPADWTPEQVEGYLIADNLHSDGAEDDNALLAQMLTEQRDAGYDLAALGMTDEDLDALLADLAADSALGGEDGGAAALTPDQARQTLADRFIVPPFSVLDARQGYWQERKRAWIALGIQSELGRGESTLDFSASCVGITDPGQRAAWNATRRADPKRAHDNGLLGESEQARSHYRGLARTNGQDLMRGEHVVGSSRMNGRPPHGPTVTRNPDGTLHYGPTNNGDGTQPGTSIFDPVLCEVVYRWFCPPDGTVLDPFAGGSVRGIVAAKLGRRYVGVDLRAEQVAANRQQAHAICQDTDPRWLVGDSRNLDKLCPDVRADLVFTCPPYYDLEVYSDDPADLSTAGTYDAFLADYRAILHAALAQLAPNRFACIVVGDVRDPQGYYRNFVADTIAIMQAAGARLYNEAILVTAVGSLPVRAGRVFSASRKLGKTHQNVLVFCKGDARAATEACGAVEVALPDDMGEEATA